MKAAENREEELRQQIAALRVAGEREEEPEEMVTPPFWGQPFCKEIDKTAIPPNFREIIVEPFDGSQDPHAHLQAFQTQIYISGGNDRLSCKLFPGTLRGVAMQWMSTLPPRSIQTFRDLAGFFLSQFAANKVKRLEVTDLFDVKQGEGESLKKYLARFNNATVRVDDPDQKFFVKAFQKGLRAGPFSDALALRKPTNMEEIRARTEKHVEMEEDQLERRRSERKMEQKVARTAILTGANATPLGRREPAPSITFDDRDMRGRTPDLDEPMVISMGVAGYKVERVLVDQGSSLGGEAIQECSGNLYGFAGECVPIIGTLELETCLGERPAIHTLPVLYTVVDAPASYNIILGRPALNKFGAIVSTKHLCMKFPVGREVGSVWADAQTARKCYEDSLRVEKSSSRGNVNILDLDLDPRGQFEKEGPLPAEELKEITLGPKQGQTTRIGTAMSQEEEGMLIAVLVSNHDVFAWSAQDMPGVDPGFVCHQLS
ncbi:hypothetical protein CR513_42877, partial [Mucuna pruriens]